MSSSDSPPPPPENPYGQTPPPPPPPPPSAPYGAQQPGYGTPPPAYGGQPGAYGQQPAYGGYPGAPVPIYPYAGWGKRVGATLIDLLLAAVAAAPLWIGLAVLIASASGATTTYNSATGSYETTGGNEGGAAIGLVLLLVGSLTYLAFIIWNQFVKQGRTGYTIGKGVLGIKLVGEASGQPIGAGMCFVRQLCHVLDGFCYIGYLWPLWDAKKQTFADKILSTVVFDSPKPS